MNYKEWVEKYQPKRVEDQLIFSTKEKIEELGATIHKNRIWFLTDNKKKITNFVKSGTTKIDAYIICSKLFMDEKIIIEYGNRMV